MADIESLKRLGLAYGGVTIAVALVAAFLVVGNTGKAEATMAAAYPQVSTQTTVMR